MKLSEVFESPAFPGIPFSEAPALELEARVLNINEGKNKQIADKCRMLSQYSALTAKVREYEKEGFILKEAVKKAVIYCRDHDILKEFLEKNASEVLNMLMTEWNWDDAKKVWQAEAREEGRKEGRNEERMEIARKMKDNGFSIAKIVEYSDLSPEVVERI